MTSSYDHLLGRAEDVYLGSGLLKALGIAKMRATQPVLDRVLNPDGSVTWDAIYRALPAQNMCWSPGDTGFKPVSPQGTVTILRAYCATAPSTGPATVRLVMARESVGEEVIAELTIPQGHQFGLTTLNVRVEANDWLGAYVHTANGASAVSLSVAVKARQI